MNYIHDFIEKEFSQTQELIKFLGLDKLPVQPVLVYKKNLEHLRKC